MELVSWLVNFTLHTKFWSENLKGRHHSEDLDVDGRIIRDSILGK
jgi:hypothetical protein